jgi:hypothetical protein
MGHQVIIKHRLFTWFENGDSPAMPGETVRLERINYFGDDVEITDDQSYERGKKLNAFFSDEDAKAIREGTYSGPEVANLQVAKGLTQRPTVVTPLDDEGPQIGSVSAQELGEYINEHKLNVDETVALAPEGDVDGIEKVYDAENHAAQLRDNDPRKGVTDKLDAMLAAASEAK